MAGLVLPTIGRIDYGFRTRDLIGDSLPRVVPPAPFDPLAALADVVAWYDAQYAAGLWQDGGSTPAASDNDAVGRWEDRQTGGIGHLNEATNKPTLKVGIANGLDAVRFDGTNDILASAEWTAADTGWHWFVVASTHVASAFGQIVEHKAMATNQGTSLRQVGTSGKPGFVDSEDNEGAGCNNGGAPSTATGSGTDMAAAGFQLLEGSFDPASDTWTLYQGATLVEAEVKAPDSALDANARVLTLGGRNDLSLFFDGDIAEVIVCNSLQLSAPRLACRAYLAARYGVAA